MIFKRYFSHEYKRYTAFIRVIEVIPSFSINLNMDYSFESIRFSWLGFMAGIYLQNKQTENE